MRYLGNKKKLLDKIDNLLIKKNLKNRGKTFCDLFCGTATVSDFFKDTYKIIANDNLYLCYVLSCGKLRFNKKNLFFGLGFDPFSYFNSTYIEEKIENYTCGFCYNNFAPNISKRQYFSDFNAKKIDFIRETIDTWAKSKKITPTQKMYLIACLLESVSKVSNVAGVYSAFLHIWDARAIKKCNSFLLK